MNAHEFPGSGIVYTFYSYKGGVGRSMAAANVAALMAKWGHSVLIVDWDLEAPGLERFFVRPPSAAEIVGKSKPGIVDLIESTANGNHLSWQDCVHTFTLGSNVTPVSLISAGQRGDGYVRKVQELDFSTLFAAHNLGGYIEELRSAWLSKFDFVLIDSRTGVTDIGGICTVHLADVLVLLFTSTDSSVDGALDIINRARVARQQLPVDRGRLLAVPLPARDESRTEYERAAEWRKIFARNFEFLYRDWLPSESLLQEAMEILRIPYIPYWSFGERLPVLEEGSADPSGLAYAYETLARLLVAKLDWNQALKERTSLPPPSAKGRRLDDAWAKSKRKIALNGLHSVSKKAFTEIYHCCVDSPIDRLQDQLLTAARLAQVHTFGWPVGVVLDRDEVRPKPTNEGIVADVKASWFTGGKMYDYWILTRKGDFYTLFSLFEDDKEEGVLYFDTQIVRTTEALLHCGNLYRALGADSKASIQLRMSYGGLRGRRLKGAGNRRILEAVNEHEDEVQSEVMFRLDELDATITKLVMDLCSPLFMLFDFFNLPQSAYEGIVTDFLAGRVT